MKIAFVTTDLSPTNGWGRHSLEIIKRLPRYGIEPIVLARNTAPPCHDPDVAFHPILRSYSDFVLKGPALLHDRWRSREFIRGCDAVHCLAEPLLLIARALCKGETRLIATAVGTYSLTSLSGRWGKRYGEALRSADAISAISHYTAARLEAELPDVAGNIRVIPPGVEVDPKTRLARANERENAFLMVGEVKARKGTLEAIRALGIVARRFPASKLYIVGANTSSYAERAVQTARSLGLEASVVFAGVLSQAKLKRLYARVKALVMPSQNIGQHFEGFGLVHLEANAQGVPTIGSRGCGNEDAIRHELSGYLLDQGDTAGLARRMTELIHPDFDWDGMSKSAFEFAQSMSWERVARDYAELYRELHPQR